MGNEQVKQRDSSKTDYKDSMNSVYGFTGSGKNILPYVPIASTATAKGRSIRASKLTIDTSKLWPIALKSIRHQEEESGNIETVQVGNTVTYIPHIKHTGGVDTVALPSGDAYHTHPRECLTLDDCSLLPPSAVDMKIFASRKNTQFVLTRHYIYLVKLREEYKDINPQLVYDYFILLENIFDDVEKGHDFYDSIWENACAFCNWFTIYKFTNKDCIKKNNGKYQIRTDGFG